MLEQLVLGHAPASVTADLADVGLDLFHDSPRYLLSAQQHRSPSVKEGGAQSPPHPDSGTEALT
jgi:hypothetical protein